MTLTGADLGVLTNLARALGVVDASGSFNADWMSAPGDRLKHVLADDTQRAGLIGFIDEVLGDAHGVADPSGLVWLPVFDRTEAGQPTVTVYVVLDEHPADHVCVGVGVAATASDGLASIKTHVPIFRAVKLGHAAAPDPIVLGTADGVITLEAAIVIEDPMIRSVSLSTAVPTGGSAEPTLGLALEGLQLPGAPAPRDLRLSMTDLDELEDGLTELVLGLIKAQVDTLGGGPLAALAGLVGLRGGSALPDLPVQDVIEHGVSALARWFGDVIRGEASRAIWLAELADLLGGTADDEAVTFSLGSARLRLGARAGTGTAGHPTVTPFVAVEVGDAGGDVVASAAADLTVVDLGSGAVRALPSCTLGAVLGRRPSGAGTPLLTGDPAVDRFVVGFALDPDRRPTLRLAAEHVTIGGHVHEVVDLSTPGAVADAAGTVVVGVVDDLLGQLGAVGDAVRTLLGLATPTGFPAVPTVDLAHFVQDPLGAIACHWRTLLDQHPDAVPAVLRDLRDLVADAAVGAVDVSGIGTEAEPWRMPIVDVFELRAWVSGGVLIVALGADSLVEDLDGGGAHLEFGVSVGLVALDLASRRASFLPVVAGSLAGRARSASGPAAASVELGPIAFRADEVGLGARWQPEQGLSVDVLAPNLALRVGEVDVPTALPVVGADGTVTLSDEGWDAVEGLLGALADAAPVELAADLAHALGWRLRPPGEPAGGPRLRLADLRADATHAIEDWLVELALGEAGELVRLLRPLARALSGAPDDRGSPAGSGTPVDPWRMDLDALPAAPSLAAWVEPAGPGPPRTEAPSDVVNWSEGMAPLPFERLVHAVEARANGDPALAALLRRREDLPAGLEALVARWDGSDGRVIPPPAGPPGVTVTTLDGLLHDGLAAGLDLPGLLERPPATVVRVSVGEHAWSAGAPAERIVRLDAAGLPPEAFAPPAAVAGDWYVVLADRGSAKLASGDPDGIAGQAGRLRRVLAALATVDDAIAVVATAEAGHAAVRAADAVAGVADVVTLGTPWSPVTLSVVDVAPAAEAGRFLAALVPTARAGEDGTGSDLARARSLLAVLLAAVPVDDPVRELRPPSGGTSPFRTGLNVHAVFGVASVDLVRRAMTALFVEGLRRRDEAAEAQPFAAPEALRTGVRLPLAVPAPTGVSVDGYVTVELAGLEHGAADAIGLPDDRAIHVHVEFSRVGGWLVGGPDPARVPGSRHDVDLRWVEADVTVPVSGSRDRANARLVLHEPRVLGLAKTRWIVRTTGTALVSEEATPALPEVRVLLSALSEALASAAVGDPALASAIAALEAIGIVNTAGGGSVPDAVDHLLHDPVGFSVGVMGDAARRAALAAALRALVGGTGGTGADALTWTAGPATVTLDLAARRVAVDMTGTGAVPWSLHAAADSGRPDVRLALGSAGGTPAGGTPAGGGLLTLATSPALSAVAEWHRAGGAPPEAFRLWPAPDAPALLRLAAQVVRAELGRVSLEYLRGLDEDARPLADAALEAFGLLAAAPGGDGVRPLRLPLGLIADPLGWLTHAGALGGPGLGLDPAKAAAALDALKLVLGVAGSPGEWDVADGAKVRADAHEGHLRLGIEVETTGLAPIPPTEERLAASVVASLVLPPGRVPEPAVELSVGLAGAAPGRRAVHVVLLDGGVRAFVRPDAGPDVGLYPSPPGLGRLAGAGTHALPLVLNAIAAETGSDLKGRAGAVVRAVGDAMGLRTDAPARFHDAELQGWAGDPAGRLAARLPTLSAAALEEIATALGPALPSEVTAAVAGNELRVNFNTVTVSLGANPFAVRFVAAPTNVPGLGRVGIEALADGSGLGLLDVKAGPAALEAGEATLRPYFRARVGTLAPGGRRAELGIALDAAGTKAFAARWLLGGSFAVVAIDGATEDADPAAAALAALAAVVDLAGSLVVAADAFEELLGRACGVATIGDVLEGVVVRKDAATWKPVDGLFHVEQILGRLQRLGLNLVRVAQLRLDLAELSLALVESPPGALGIEMIPKGRYLLGGGDVTISLEFDASWIEKTPAPQPGLLLRLMHVGEGDPESPGEIAFETGLQVYGVGFRIARTSGQLLEVGSVSLASIGLHLYGEVGLGNGLGGGLQLQLSDLAVGTAGAGGGNQVAKGVMKDAGSGDTKLAPRFSPAVAVQRPPGGEVLVSLRAGDPPGPWWLAIQRGFGPVYIEQVGFDAKVEQRHLKSISILLDGRVSIFGLAAAVDDLSLMFVVASDASLFDPGRWAVDLAGFAIGSDIGGIELAGGLRKFAESGPPGQPDTVQYIGMLLGRFGTYGLSVFGGYGLGRDPYGETFASFFAFGAVNGPIGGPPAFFLTGIGGGLSINRDLVFPQELSEFATFPFIQALDPGAQPPSDPMAVLEQYKDTFPIRQGQFWFAAGISFNSFALVDGVAVVAIAVGDGFELTLLGLARMALPRPQLALVSIELGLVCRFSSREGVLWIQAQLTDNSWLLFPEVRLTGGFAFVTWFRGPYRGQFVLTLGGYHPSFHRDGYPLVPRLGFHVDLGPVTIKGENYFALTSEALMAGGKLEASADLGPAWAHVVFGADGIVFFDPLWLDARVYARISAGITIDVWIGEITISVSLGASIHVTGPEFHGEATFEIGPVELTVPFGEEGSEPQYIDYPTFVRKYLEEAPGGAARALSSITGRGSLVPRPGPGGAKDIAPADGSAAKPLVVISEFECLVTSTVPLVEVRADATASSRSNPSHALGIAPMSLPKMEPALRLRIVDSHGHDHLPDLLGEAGRPRIQLDLRTTGTFPVAVWGPPQDKDAKKVPAGDVITATEGVRVDFHAKVEPGLPPVKYEQVETGRRRPLPFVRPSVRGDLMSDAAVLEALVPSDDPVLDVAAHVLAKAGNSLTAIAALPHDRAAPPRLGSLTEGLVTDGPALRDFVSPEAPQPAPIDHRVLPPVATAGLSPAVSLPERLVGGTTVSDAPEAPRRTPPTHMSVQAAVDVAVAASLRRVPTGAVAGKRTVLPSGTIPLTRPGRAPVAAVRGRGAVLDGRQRLEAITASLHATIEDPAGSAAPAGGGTLAPGEVTVLQLPNAARDAADGDRPSLGVDGEARVLVLAHGGAVLADELRPRAVVIPPGSERIVVLALGDREADAGNGLLCGWHTGQQLASAGWNAALGSRCLVSAEGVTVAPLRQRRGTGWVKGAELVRGTTTVTTRLADRPRAVAVVLDQPPAAQAGEGLAMTLGGAGRMTGPDGRPLPPTVVASGARSAVVYPIEPRGGTVTVTVASEAGWHLAGVLGGPDLVAVTDAVAERGLDAAVRPMAAGSGRVSLTWKGA